MIVLIGNLPDAVSERDLQHLAHPPGAAPVRIIRKRNHHGVTYRYGLVHARNERDGQKIIKRLNGRTCAGAVLVAREYSQRRLGNERRRLDWREVPWTGVERRLGERRVSGNG